MSTARSFAEKRRRDEARKAAQEKARREREAAIAREKYLDSIANRTVELWEQVEPFIATRQSKNYDLAIQHLVDQRDLAERQGTESDFADRMTAFHQFHARKPPHAATTNPNGRSPATAPIP